MILAYIVRHGSTDISPKPEWWSQIPLSNLGLAQARTAAAFLDEQKVKPVWGVSSDLKRAEQTLTECANVLKLRVVRPMKDLRAYGQEETPEAFEARNLKAFTAILATARRIKSIPLIACHRSNTAWIAKNFDLLTQKVDYREASLVHEGGVIVIDNKGARPIFGQLSDNPRANLDPSDGTPTAGFVTKDDNHPPRDCGHCKWFDVDHCDHPVVTADDLIGIYYERKRNEKGKWRVEPEDCCNNMQHIEKLDSIVAPKIITRVV